MRMIFIAKDVPGSGYNAVIWFFLFRNASAKPSLQTSRAMKIYINNKPSDTAAATLADLAVELSLPDRGVAMALGTQMVQRTEWTATTLKDGDSVIIIKAACGG